MDAFPNIAIQVTICNIVCGIIVAIVVSLRLYTRIHIAMGLGSDDYVLLVAVAVWFAMLVLFQLATMHGLGAHVWNIDGSVTNSFIRYMVAGGTLYNITMLCSKLSILLLYRRLFPIETYFKRWWAVTVFTVSYSLVIAIASVLGRTPVASRWCVDMHQIGDACSSKWAFYVANSAFNAFSDLLILALPIPIVWKLSLDFRQRITLSIVFALGSISCIVSIVRLKSVIVYLKEDDSDITYDTVKLVLWSLIETTISIVCVCTPTLRPLFRRYFGAFFSWSGSNDEGKTNVYGRRSHVTMSRMRDDNLELGNPQRTDTVVEAEMPNGYGCGSTELIVRKGSSESSDSLEQLGSSRGGGSGGGRGGHRARAGSIFSIHVQKDFEVRSHPALAMPALDRPN